jgi:2-iminobutanoate/2-iminopropanoate deaminase
MLKPRLECYGEAVAACGQVLSTREARGFVYVSGQLGVKDGRLCGRDIVNQAHQAINLLEAALQDRGLGLADVVNTTVWLTRPEDFAAFSRVFRERFGPVPPARSTVVADQIIPGALVQIEAVAARPE